MRQLSILFNIEARLKFLPQALIYYSKDKNLNRNADIEQKDSFQTGTST